MLIQVAALACCFWLSSAFTLPKKCNLRLKTESSWCSTGLAAVSTNQDLLPGISAIDANNQKILEQLHELRENPSFSLYSIDILGSCEYMPQELFECYSETCEVYPVDEDQVPEAIRSADFSEIEFDIDGWARWDMPSSDYYDTEEFPEGYTGYDGSEIWRFVHERICFNGYDYDDNHWKADFNKAVSGLHSVVSAQVTRGIRDKISDGEEFAPEERWRDPASEFSRRLSPEGQNPRAIENLYFAYMLFLSAAAKAKGRLLSDCASGKIDSEASRPLAEFLNLPLLDDPSVQVAPQKLRLHAAQQSSDLWEARMRTRELLRLMNCVQCNKCRFHGKIAMMGLSTALQIHLGKNGEGADPSRIHRVELAALISTMYKFARAVQFCNEMT